MVERPGIPRKALKKQNRTARWIKDASHMDILWRVAIGIHGKIRFVEPGTMASWRIRSEYFL